MSQQAKALLSSIDNCPDRDVYSYFHKVLDVCCDTDHMSDELAAQTHLWADAAFASKYVPSVWPSVDALREATGQFTKLCYQLACELVEPETFISQQPFSGKAQAILQECIEVRQKELLKAVVFKAVTTKVAYLENYDWSVSVVLSSDRMKSIKESIVKLNLVIHRPTGPLDIQPSPLAAATTTEPPTDDANNTTTTNDSNQLDESIPLFAHSSSNSNPNASTRSISFEFTKQELASFIQNLEEAKQALTQAMAV